MGASKASSAEREALLPPPIPAGYVAVAAEEVAEAGGGLVPVRQWEGSLLQCCGNCTLVGWGSCLVARYLPCVAFGQNVKRGLRQSAWLHGITYLLLLVVVSWLAVGASLATYHNVLAQCNGDLIAPRQDSPAWLADTQGRGLWGKPDWPGHRGDEDLDDGHHGKHHHDEGDDEDDDDGHSKHHHDEGADGENDGVGRDGEYDGHKGHHHDKHDDEGGHAGHHEHSGHKHGDPQGKHSHAERPDKGPAPELHEVTNMPQTEPWGRRPVLDQAAYHRHHSFTSTSRECQRARAVNFSACLALLLSVLAGVHYAACRRTMLRKQFGIAGSRLGDFCAWCWCGPCALCQETRTLWTNNVHGGVWHGPTQLVASTGPPVAPASQFMTADV